MNISDTFYVALCMTILIIGVVYWFWTQNQYIQRKLNLLENIVYEMKTNLNNAPESPELGSEIKPTEYPPAPSSEMGDDDDLLHEQLHNAMEQVQNENQNQGQTQDLGVGQEKDKPTQSEIAEFQEDEIADDLQPGGIGSSLNVEIPADSTGSSLDSMTLKELKRLAEQRKIAGASNMRKQGLITALRNCVDKEQVVGDIADITL